jgi:hypothetical protein
MEEIADVDLQCLGDLFRQFFKVLKHFNSLKNGGKQNDEDGVVSIGPAQGLCEMGYFHYYLLDDGSGLSGQRFEVGPGTEFFDQFRIEGKNDKHLHHYGLLVSIQSAAFVEFLVFIDELMEGAETDP